MTTDDERSHEWGRTSRGDGLWCFACGLSHAQWKGYPCGGPAALERRLVESGAVDAFRGVGDFDASEVEDL